MFCTVPPRTCLTETIIHKRKITEKTTKAPNFVQHTDTWSTHTLCIEENFFTTLLKKNFFQIYLPFNVSARSRLVYAHSGLQDETTRREFSSLETEFFFAPKVVQPRSKRNGGQMECCSNEEHLLIVC